MSANVAIPDEDLLFQELLRLHGASKLCQLLLVQILRQEVVLEKRHDLAHFPVRLLVGRDLREIQHGEVNLLEHTATLLVQVLLRRDQLLEVLRRARVTMALIGRWRRPEDVRIQIGEPLLDVASEALQEKLSRKRLARRLRRCDGLLLLGDCEVLRRSSTRRICCLLHFEAAENRSRCLRLSRCWGLVHREASAKRAPLLLHTDGGPGLLRIAGCPRVLLGRWLHLRDRGTPHRITTEASLSRVRRPDCGLILWRRHRLAASTVVPLRVELRLLHLSLLDLLLVQVLRRRDRADLRHLVAEMLILFSLLHKLY